MNSDTFKGKWEQLKGELKTQWGKLTDDDLKVIDGNVDKFVGKVQELYGEARDAVMTKVNQLTDRFRDAADKAADKVKDAHKSA